MECKICFCEIETELGYQCKRCDAALCKECFIKLLDFCNVENMLISCVLCKGEVLYQNVKLEYKLKYNKMSVKYLMNKKDIKDKIEENIKKEKFYEKIYKEREDFVKTMPDGIQLLIKIALTKKMKKIKKDNIMYIQIKQKQRKCMREICKGFLNELGDNFECDVCKIKYCKKCESKINNEETQVHICKKEEIESLDEMKTYIKCPNCILPVVKSEGCNNMTCSICKTNFCYITGVIIKDGNHDDTILKLKEYRLSDKIIRENKYSKEIIMMLLEIENNEPIKGNIINIIKNLKNTDIENLENLESSLITTISKRYSKYREQKEEYEIYYKKLLDIDMYNEKNIQENDMKNTLVNILNNVKKNEHFDKNNYLIPKESEEYILIEEKIKKEGCKSNILYMEKLKNTKLEKQFIEYKINMKDKQKFELKMLYHGTGEDNVEMIIKDGFNTKYNIVSAYGKGTYLSDSFQYSEGYTKISAKGNKNILICECIVKSKNIKNKNIYCFENNKQIIPRILVVFK